MSHFTCYVVIKNEEGLELGQPDFEQKILEKLSQTMRPFQEEADDEFMEHVDLTQEYTDQFNGIPTMRYTGEPEVTTIPIVVETSTGRVVGGKYDSETNPEIEAMYQRKEDSPFGSKEFVLPKGFELKDVIPKEFYKTLEEFVADYHGDEDLVMGYKTNPNAKWDWYQVGGRWSHCFKPKANATGLFGEESWTGSNGNKNNVDIIKRKDIDVEGMVAELKASKQEEWDKYWAVSNIDLSKYKTWSQLIEAKREELSLRDSDVFPRDVIDQLRVEYNNQEGIKEVKDLEEKMRFHFGSVVEYFCFGDYEKFMKKAEFDAISSYSILKDGEWFEKGKMGWFATQLTETKDYEELWLALFDSIDPEDWVINVDCHI